MNSRRAISLFLTGSFAGLLGLGFNFLLRLGGLAPFPPESALSTFLRVVPASIEEPMVQRFGDLAGELGLVIATLIAAATYGLVVLLFDALLAEKVFGRLKRFEGTMVVGLISWAIFGLILFPLDGDALFGSTSPYAQVNAVWVFPLGLLLVQAVFALLLSAMYLPAAAMKTPIGEPSVQDMGRREFIEKGTVVVLAVVAGIAGLMGLDQFLSSSVQPTGTTQPVNLQEAPSIFRDPRLASLVDSEVTPDSDFYRVAIDVIDPTVDASTWSLVVDGLVKAPKSYTMQELTGLPQTSQYTTLECVSNELNGNLIGNANWTGVKISDLLADVGGVGVGATYVVFYSVDGYSVGIPLARALMPDSIVAYGMNGQSLPVRHGYPLRGLIPGLYGMMSAKWVNRISVVSSVYEGYWQTRGWTNIATVHSEAFIVPLPPAQASLSKYGGSIILSGYAFAGDRGISKVEVSLDNGRTWEEAQIKPPISDITWALWAYEWNPPSAGEYSVLARAVDAAGGVETSSKEGTYPNGATGYVNALVQIFD
ncbi:MAG: molybdopterin-dependent oxidoreductase [Nitrososphaerota archaeon]|nr:molybdopterin-dependent oxidoreductase [Nitrososphaerota archaeon]